MSLLTYCDDKYCKEIYPLYGLAPHTHKLGSRGFMTSTKIIDKKDWPSNFKEDPSEPGMGFWYCPHCLNGESKENENKS